MSAAPGGSLERPIAVRIERVEKWFGAYQALKTIDLEVRKGEKIVIFGPSCSGKSTLIRCFNGLERYDAERIVINGIEVGDSPRAILDVRREVGLVFQPCFHRQGRARRESADGAVFRCPEQPTAGRHQMAAFSRGG